MSEVTVKLMRLRVAPRKVRLVIDLVRGQDVSFAESQLLYLPKRAAEPIRKLVGSGIAAAKSKGIDLGKLWIKRIVADEGPAWKRQIPHFRGMVLPQRRATTHITLTLSDDPKPERKRFKGIRGKGVKAGTVVSRTPVNRTPSG